MPSFSQCYEKNGYSRRFKSSKTCPQSKISVLGNVAKDCGWTQQELIDELKEERISKNHEWYVKKVECEKAKEKECSKNAELKKVNDDLAKYGY